MIIDKLSHANRYTGLALRIKTAFEYLLNTDLETLADGKHVLDGENLFALKFRYTSKLRENAEWEAHRRYADLQYIVSGEECMGVALDGRLKEEPYDASKDCMVLTGAYSDIITVKAGEFVIFWPGEAHAPNLEVEVPGPVVKVVLKMACD